MKLLPLLLLVLPAVSFADVVTLGDTRGLHQRFVWSLSSERIEKLPLRKKEEALPLSPQRAEAIAYEWTRHQTLFGFIPERPYMISLVQFPAPHDARYFYKVHFATSDGSDGFWTVHVLMDGSIVEPMKKEANQASQPTPVNRRG